MDSDDGLHILHLILVGGERAHLRVALKNISNLLECEHGLQTDIILQTQLIDHVFVRREQWHSGREQSAVQAQLRDDAIIDTHQRHQRVLLHQSLLDDSIILRELVRQHSLDRMDELVTTSIDRIHDIRGGSKAF